MKHASTPYTLGIWMVRQGNEEAFIEEWGLFARWTARTQPGAMKGILLRDTEHPGQFISLGPWEDVDAIRRWRESPEFKAFASRAKELCSEFQPRSLSVAATSD